MLAVAAPQSSAMRVYQAASMDDNQLEEFTARPRIDFSSILSTVGQRHSLTSVAALPTVSSRRVFTVQVTPIVEDVRARGDEAVKQYTAKFDCVELDNVCVPIEVRLGGSLCCNSTVLLLAWCKIRE